MILFPPHKKKRFRIRFLTASRKPFATPFIAGAAFTSVYIGEGALYNVFGCYLLHPRKKIGKLHSDVHLDIKLGCHLSLLLMLVKKHSALQYCHHCQWAGRYFAQDLLFNNEKLCPKFSLKKVSGIRILRPKLSVAKLTKVWEMSRKSRPFREKEGSLTLQKQPATGYEIKAIKSNTHFHHTYLKSRFTHFPSSAYVFQKCYSLQNCSQELHNIS